MAPYIDLELLKLRADVIKAAINSNIDEVYVRREFITLCDDLRELQQEFSYPCKEASDE